MSPPAALRRGDSGEAVRDLQERLLALGYPVPGDAAGEFGGGTEAALRAFQESRGLRVDGVCGTDTWGALVESGYALGDRLLYLRRPMLRGDDVAELQRRLNGLGFDAGREDGIFGERTEHALREFQVNAGVAADGVAGPTTRAILERIGSLAAGSVASVREREALRRGPHHLAERRVYLAAEPGFAALVAAVARGLGAAGARVVVDASGGDDSVLAEEANRWGADLFLAIRSSDRASSYCAYFASRAFRSEAGFLVASRLADELDALLGGVTACGKAYPALRETRMAAVVCEVGPAADAGRLANDRAPDLAAAIVTGVRRGVEEPLDASC